MPTTFDFIPSKPDPIRPPVCPKCAAQMVLRELNTDVSGSEVQTFECAKCQHHEGRIIKVQKRDLARRCK